MKHAIALALLLAPAAARGAPAFPADRDWFPLVCDGGPMSDGFEDQAGALDERDLVGNFGAAAGYQASDADNLYLRLRLDQDPAPGGALRPFAWGVELDLDGNLTTYELLIVVDGIGTPQVSLYRNRTTTVPNSPSDPADLPAVQTAAFADAARSVVARGTRFGGDSDYFLDFAVPWSALAPVGLDRTTRASLWAGSSSVDAALDGDLACHDGRTGAPALDQVASDPTAGDPNVDTDGDGFTDAEEAAAGTDPNDPDSFPASRLEGGGGCAAGASGGGAALALAIAAACFVRLRRSRVCVRSYNRRS